MPLGMRLIEFARMQRLAFGVLTGSVQILTSRIEPALPTDEELWNELDAAGGI